jgi:hypothetical protein
MAEKKPAKKKAKDLEISKTKGGEKIKGGATMKQGTLKLTGTWLS